MEKIKDHLWLTCIPILLLGLWLSLFNQENLRVVIYTLICYAPLYLFYVLKTGRKDNWYVHCLWVFILYIVLQIILQASPWLQIKEFEWTHPHWQPARQVQLVDAKSEIHRRTRSVSYAYMDVIYRYEYQGKTYSAEQSELTRQYFLNLLGEETPALRHLSASKLKNGFLNGQAVVLVNSQSPEQSRYFYSQSRFDLRGSWLAKILWGLQLAFAGAVLVMAGLAVKKVVNPHNTIQTWSRTRRYVFIIVFFVVGWTVLFAGWILFMYIKNSG